MAFAIRRFPSFLLCLGAIVSCTAAPPQATAPVQPTQTVAAEPARAVAPAVKIDPVRTEFELSKSAKQGGIIIGRVPSGTSEVKLDGKILPITDDGYVLLGFNRDAEPTAALSWIANGMAQSRMLSVAPGTWRLERVNLSLPRGRKASERRAKELSQIRGARAQNNENDGWQQDFIWPARGRISGLFGAQRIYRGQPGGYHTGLDIAAPNGTPFVAPADGVVTLATPQPFSREGYLLMVDHGMGLNSAFVHCSAILVKAGDVVKQGQVIGRIGQTGGATGPHLHWSMMWNAARVDPLLMLPPQ